MSPSKDNHSTSPQDLAAIQQEVTTLRQSNQYLEGQVKSLEKQLAWFKKQVFGPSSEKRLIQSAEQADLLAGLAVPEKPQAPETETITYERKKGSKNRGDAIHDTGLRFDETVEVKEIRLPVPELEGPEADHYIVIDEHVTCRLAQRRSAYVVLKYIQPVVKNKVSGVIATKCIFRPKLITHSGFT